MEISFTISDIFMIEAVLLAPLIAIQVDKCLEKKRENKRGKIWVFKTLMATRGKVLDPNHVQALNMIDLEFVESKYHSVSIAWKALLDHFVSVPNAPQYGANNYDTLKATYDSQFAIWGVKFQIISQSFFLKWVSH